MDLEKLKREIRWFDKYDLYMYGHDNWVTTTEGVKITSFITKLIEYTQKLEERIEQLESEKEKD